MMQILEKNKSKIYKTLIVLATSILMQILIPIMFPDFLYPIGGYMVLFTVIFLVANVIIYFIVYFIRKSRNLIFIIPAIYFLFSVLFFTEASGLHPHTGTYLVVSIVIYFLSVIIRKYSLILLMPVIYFFLGLVFYVYSLWSLELSGLAPWFYSDVYEGFSKLFFLYALSLVPISLIFLIIYLYGRFKPTKPPEDKSDIPL